MADAEPTGGGPSAGPSTANSSEPVTTTNNERTTDATGPTATTGKEKPSDIESTSSEDDEVTTDVKLLNDWDTTTGEEHEQLQAIIDDREAKMMDIRLGWVTMDVRYHRDNWSDKEFNREVLDSHVQRLKSSFVNTGCNRVRGDLPIMAMTSDDFHNYLEHTIATFGLNPSDTQLKATNPDAYRAKHHPNTGVVRSLDELVHLTLPKAIIKDPRRHPELHAGRHRFRAMAAWALERDKEGSKLSDQLVEDADDATRKHLIELFAFGVHILDKKKLYADDDLLRWVRANRTEVRLQNSEGDTFRLLRTAWSKLTAAERESVIKKEDPKYPHGFAQWVSYTTGTQMQSAESQNRLKRVLTNPRFSKLADQFCMYSWGRAHYSNTGWGRLISAAMPTFLTDFLNVQFSLHHKTFPKDYAFQVTDLDVELLLNIYDWNTLRYSDSALEALFFPIDSDPSNRQIMTPSPQQWQTTMQKFKISDRRHPGREYRHPTFLTVLPIADYEKAYRLLCNRGKREPLLSGTLLSHLASSIIPILSSVLQFLYYLYNPVGYLPSGRNNNELKSFDVVARLRPLCRPTALGLAQAQAQADNEVFTGDNDLEDDIDAADLKMHKQVAQILINLKSSAPDWARGENVIRQVLDIKPEWRATMTEDTQYAILHMLSKETWLHPILKFIFITFDLTQMTGVGAALRDLYAQGITPWDPKHFEEQFPRTGTDLMSRYKATPRLKCFPRASRESMGSDVEHVFELLTLSREVAEALTLVREYHEWKIAQVAQEDPSTPPPAPKDGIRNKRELKYYVRLIDDYASRLHEYGVQNIPSTYDDIKTADMATIIARLPHKTVLGLVPNWTPTGVHRSTMPRHELLRGYTVPANIEAGDEWYLKQTKTPKGRKRPASGELVDESDESVASEAQETPVPSRPKRRRTDAGSNTASPRAKPDASLFTVTRQPSENLVRSAENPVLNTLTIDDDRGNPFLPGASLASTEKWHNDIYARLGSSMVKGQYKTQLKQLRRRQLQQAKEADSDFAIANEQAMLNWVPDRSPKRATPHTPRRRSTRQAARQ